MPIKEFNTKADFDAAYSVGVESDGRPSGTTEVRLNYHRAVMLPICQHRADFLVSHFAWPTNTNILIVGAGFGWTAEILETQYGYTNIVHTDVSPWIQDNQDTSEEAEVDAAITSAGLDPATGRGAELKARLHTSGNRRRHSRSIENEDLGNQGSRNRIRNILGDISVGITESVLESLSDAEMLDISDRVDKINANIDRIHLVVTTRPGNNPGYNWHTLAEYKSLLPTDTFVSIGDWKVL